MEVLKVKQSEEMMEYYSDVLWDDSREELKRTQLAEMIVQYLDVMMDVLWEVTNDCDVTLQRMT